MSNDSAIAAIKAHHDTLSASLRRYERAVLAAAASGDADAARRQLASWCQAELLPHAAAEEPTIYLAGQGFEATRLLVQAMLDEHRALTGLVDDVARAADTIAAVAATASLASLFAVHLSKENDLLLPALDKAGVGLEAVLAGMHQVLGEKLHPSTHR